LKSFQINVNDKIAIMTDKIPHPELLNRYRQALLTHFPDQLRQLVLFGSQARGEVTAESDIDVLVVVNWEEQPLAEGRYAAPFNDPRWRRIVELAYDLSLEYGVVLSPLVMSEKRMARRSALNNQIKRDGIELWKKN
jgi:predicted nucleotidyltransferase